MAPAALLQDVPSKRPSEAGGRPGVVKQRRHYHHSHRINVRQSIDPDASAFIQDAEVITKQLERAILLVLEAVGFDGAEPAALQSLRSCVEEYMAHFLDGVQTSMRAGRRVQPVPLDFLSTLNNNQLTLRALLPHLDSPVPASKSQPSLNVGSRGRESEVQEAQLINRLLSQATISAEPHVPRNFPNLPSRHTFKADAVYQPRREDPKQIRELATEEGRLGEEALRRLMSKKASGDNTLLTGLRSGTKLSLRQRSRALWRETYKEALQKTNARQGQPMDIDGDTSAEWLAHLGPAVNADNIYWRKPIARKITENIPSDG